ncbi:unnamed protein product [Phytophthora fragariaefolia]|uniref:Unnamed protein product n=1 Tax=Phytophthora fragariaefolia TaxID=1490495 RepID=A0A9W7CSB9_9STRA|nr:unnamed protein product [Phytophthora fragariaefolia]
MDLSQLRFKVYHKAGTSMGHAEGLSRMHRAGTYAMTIRDFLNDADRGEYEQVFRVKVQLVPEVDGIPEPIFKVVGEEFKDVFPEQLPDGLPPMREVNFEVTLKKGAKPSSRAPFRLSKMEQDAFEEFVKAKLKKGWIEVSNSPWVSNIFAIPKKDPATGQIPKRAEWLRSGNTKIPLRWVRLPLP